MEDEVLDLSTIMKSGLTPENATLNGSLTPKQGRTFAKAIVSSHALLGKVTTDITGKLTKERSGLDALKGALTRHKSGEKAPASNLKELGKIGCTLDMSKGVELNAKINDDTLEDNQDNPNFEDEQFNSFSTIFSNDLLYLGIIGESDSAAHDAEFKDLARGWFTVAKESEDTIKVVSSNNSILERLVYLVKNANSNAIEMASILMSRSDYTEYQLEISKEYKDLATLLNADKKKIMEVPIEVSADVADGEYLLTPLKNMIFGISSRVKRNRWFDNEESALKYKFVVFPDYEFDIHKYVTLLTVTTLDITSYETSVAVGATSERTVQNAGGTGLSSVTAVSKNPDVSTVSYNSENGKITITGVKEGTTTIVVDDSTSTKEIAVTVTAA